MNTKGTMPKRSVRNGLEVEELPSELMDISNLENQMIAVDIPFMKIMTVHKSQLEKMVDRTVLVPLEPDDIENTLKSTLLPRSMEESAVVSVQFKRMEEMKNIHQSGFIRPVKMVKAIALFKDKKKSLKNDLTSRSCTESLFSLVFSKILISRIVDFLQQSLHPKLVETHPVKVENIVLPCFVSRHPSSVVVKNRSDCTWQKLSISCVHFRFSSNRLTYTKHQRAANGDPARGCHKLAKWVESCHKRRKKSAHRIDQILY